MVGSSGTDSENAIIEMGICLPDPWTKRYRDSFMCVLGASGPSESWFGNGGRCLISAVPALCL